MGGFGLSSAVQALGLCDTATPLTINASTGVLNHVGGQAEYYKITTPSAGLLTVLHQGNIGLVTTYYDKNCFQISGSTSGVQSLAVLKDIYFVSLSGGASGNYIVQVDGDFASDDHGVSCNSATVARSLVETGKMGPYSDSDFFQVKLVGNGLLQASTLANIGIVKRVYDKNCFLVSGATSGNVSQFFAPGIYYVALSVTGINKGNYNLNLNGDIQFPTGTCNGKAATLSGTNGDDVIKGTAGNDVIQAFSGNDVVYGLAGNDTLCGGAGDDVLQGADGLDTILGEAGNDTLQGGNQNDALDGGIGSDICDGGALTDTGTACEVFNLIP